MTLSAPQCGIPRTGRIGPAAPPETQAKISRVCRFPVGTTRASAARKFATNLLRFDCRGFDEALCVRSAALGNPADWRRQDRGRPLVRNERAG